MRWTGPLSPLTASHRIAYTYPILRLTILLFYYFINNNRLELAITTWKSTAYNILNISQSLATFLSHLLLVALGVCKSTTYVVVTHLACSLQPCTPCTHHDNTLITMLTASRAAPLVVARLPGLLRRDVLREDETPGPGPRVHRKKDS